jgi:proline dehydrogenase
VESIAFCAATHNEQSNLHLANEITNRGIRKKHPHIHFSQLYGMSDHISFNLAKDGFSVSKYVPYGPVKDVIPYLVRRAQENTAVAGQMSRELNWIKQEIERRKLEK